MPSADDVEDETGAAWAEERSVDIHPFAKFALRDDEYGVNNEE